MTPHILIGTGLAILAYQISAPRPVVNQQFVKVQHVVVGPAESLGEAETIQSARIGRRCFQSETGAGDVAHVQASGEPQ